MRAFALTAIATSLVAFTGTAPVKADGNAAVCAQTYGPDEGLRCDYANYQQCQAYVRGLAGSCIENPFPRSSPNQVLAGSRARR